jgi:nucleoid-associated protein YgaU
MNMPNDAKLGLVLGTGLVIIIAVVFFRKDSAAAREQPDRPAAAVGSPGLLPTISSRGDVGTNATETAAGTRPVPARGLKHTVKEGETLFSLAQNYYKDSARFVDIYRTNQEVLRSPDRLEPGTVLVIPGVPE